MNNDFWFALLLCAAAGLSTVLGALIVFVTRTKSERLLSFSLGFAAGMMISISMLEMFASANRTFAERLGTATGSVVSAALLSLGAVAGMLFDKLVPHENLEEDGERPHKNLLRVGMVSAIALAVHNFPEGAATMMAGISNKGIGLSVALAVALHNIPEGISIALPVYYGTGSRTKAFLYTLAAGVAEPLGGLMAALIFGTHLSELMTGAVFAYVAGIMLYISFEELIPSSRQYGYKGLALTALFIGICVMPLSGAFGI